MPKSRSITSKSSYNDDEAKKRGIWLGNCRYDVVSQIAMEKRFKLVGEMDLWYISWTDVPLSPERITEMKRLQSLVGCNSPSIQKINHFPGMYEICRKDRLGRNMNRLKKIFPRDYELFPSTWDLPSDMTELQEYGRKHKNVTYIVKPDSGCQGKGIFLVKNLKLLCPFAKCVCQLYVTQPFLIDGYKFDQRIYVLITCVDPLRIYIYNEGIARFATVKYQMPCEGNLDVTYMHLTNYSLNKFSDSYDPEYGGTKRPLSAIYEWMLNHGYDVKKLQRDIDDIVVKTIVGVAPNLRHNYRATFPKREKGCYCFEVLGFDILVDRHMKPILIEVNHSPSFNLDTEIDHVIKTKMVRNLFNMIYLGDQPVGNVWKKDPSKQEKYNIRRRPGTPYASTIPDTLKDQFAYEETHQEDFRLIFCEENPGKYDKFMDKEYFVSSYEEHFLKKKTEPRMYQGMKDPSLSSQNTLTSIRKTRAGQVYVETRSGTPNSLSNPHEFLKFKYNDSLSTTSSMKKSQGNTRFRKKKGSLFDKNFPIEETSIVGHENIGNEEENNTSVQDFSNEDKIFRQNDGPPQSAIPSSKLSPSQRVQKALEKLRRKNVEKFKLIAQQNTSMLKSYTMQAVEEQRAAYIKATGITEKNGSRQSTPAPPMKMQNNNNNEEFAANNYSAPQQKKLDESILHLDNSKLPFIFQQLSHSSRDSSGESITDSDKERQQTVLTKWLSNVSFASNAKPKTANRRISNDAGDDISKSHPNAVVHHSFRPMIMDIKEENSRRKRLSSRKRAIKILGIGETAQQIVRMVAAPDRKDV